jgi:hypothetical protein
MLKIPATLAPSQIHGRGLFAACFIPKGTVVWRFEWPDSKKLFLTATDREKHFGYVNPANPEWLVICGDDSCFWNFSATPNCVMDAPPARHREAMLIASCDILEGVELTVGTDTDLDSSRKLSF